jgi:hypothetical protein
VLRLVKRVFLDTFQEVDHRFTPLHGNHVTLEPGLKETNHLKFTGIRELSI